MGTGSPNPDPSPNLSPSPSPSLSPNPNQAAGLMAAREALETKQAALELSLRELLASGRRDDGDGGRGCPSDDALRPEGSEVEAPDEPGPGPGPGPAPGPEPGPSPGGGA